MMSAGAVVPILTITALMKMTGMMTMRPAAVILLLLVLLIVRIILDLTRHENAGA